VGSVFNPNDFTAIRSTLTVGAGDTLLFETGLDGVAPRFSINGAAAGSGVTARSQSGLVELAVFTFGSIEIGAGATVNVDKGFWGRGLVLASQSDLSFATTLNLSGASASGATRGTGGPGGDGDVSSIAPGPGGGDGGSGAALGWYGIGRGAQDGKTQSNSAGSGASYGGSAGWGAMGRAPGPVYGDSALTDLFGGSGGAGGSSSGGPGGGGGGGGSLEFVAMDTLTMSGTLIANGGNGGTGYISGGAGGSGGGVLLAADSIDFSGSIGVSGGAGGDGAYYTYYSYGGGGGGGGRVAFYANSLNNGGTVSSSGGAGGLGLSTYNPRNGGPGAAGTFSAGEFAFPHGTASVPEPSTFAALIGMSVIGLAVARRKRKAA
jgi:hypothetical protein